MRILLTGSRGNIVADQCLVARDVGGLRVFLVGRAGWGIHIFEVVAVEGLLDRNIRVLELPELGIVVHRRVVGVRTGVAGGGCKESQR